MTEDRSNIDDKALDTLFESARRTAPVAEAAFLDRLCADMVDHLPSPRASGAPASPATGSWTRFRGLFAASGLTGAAALGVWIGFVMPETLSTLALGYDVTEASGIGAFLPSADLVALAE
jgi:hypothetical protein